MPMTLGEKEYIELMAQKGVDAAEARPHHRRIAAMLKTLPKDSSLGLFGAVDVGSDACWCVTHHGERGQAVGCCGCRNRL